MFSVCPECKTVFEINAGHLAAAAGRVRCGKCDHLFNAAETVSDTLDDARAQIRTLDGAGNTVNSAIDTALSEIDGQTVDGVQIRADVDFYANPVFFAQTNDENQLLHNYWSMDDEVVPQKNINKSKISRILGFVAIALLVAVGFLWTQSARLSTNPSFRVFLEPFCRVAGCEIPVRQDMRLYEIVTLQVTDNPRVKGTLLLTLVFKNKAGFVQPFPILRVAFSDKSGVEVSVREFQPHEYLSDDGERLSGFGPGARKRLLFEMPDPGEKAVSYQLDFVKRIK